MFVVFLSQGRFGIMRVESTAMMSNPRESPHTNLIHKQPIAQVTHLHTTAHHIILIIISLLIEGLCSSCSRCY